MQHILVLGGSTAGASVVAQLRRQSEACRITLLEKSPYLATAYCGLAYAAGGIVRPDPDYLRPLDPASLAARFNAEVHTGHTVRSIYREERIVCSEDSDGKIHAFAYDRLVYALGARSRVPAIPGASGGLAGVHTLRTTEDLAGILAHIEAANPRRAVIIGGGFIGLELAEGFRYRGLEVSLIEQGADLMTGKLDPDMARQLLGTLADNEVQTFTEESVTAVSPGDRVGVLRIATTRRVLEADMVVFTAGIQPNVELAVNAGLQLGPTGALKVDDAMRTSDPAIFALGDAAEIACRVSGRPVHVPLAGPLGRQAKVLAANLAGKPARYPGTLGTFVCKVFDKTVASTGMTEAQIQRAGIPYHRVLLPSTNHVYFYPGVQSMLLKLMFTETGALLGAQAVGGEGTDKRIDVLATALAAGMDVRELEYLELAYAPPYGAPKDAVNQAGALAAAILDGDRSLLHPDDLAKPAFKDAVLVDIRSVDEFEASGLAGAIHLQAETLRSNLDQVPRGRPVVVYCNSGAKGISAQRLLASAGFTCFNLMGGLMLVRRPSATPDLAAVGKPEAPLPFASALTVAGAPLPACDVELDLRGLVCPGPLVGARKHLADAPPGQTVRILTSDAGFRDDFKRLIGRLALQVQGEGRHPGGGQWIVVRTPEPD